MVRLSFKPEEINDVFQLTAAVLQLGNLTVCSFSFFFFSLKCVNRGWRANLTGLRLLQFGPEMTGSGPDASRSVVTDKGQAQVVAGLLGVDSAALETALTSRLMEIRYLRLPSPGLSDRFKSLSHDTHRTPRHAHHCTARHGTTGDARPRGFR
jgi:hypothetical protein